jgi:alkanesulfonate monooxygenase SsuD/methylene tetrahydromethanopterin reductase-like flavin-dependent oxidoreductase (luciferase family)
MRIGMYLPYVDRDGALLDGHGTVRRAQLIEAAGLDGAWLGDHTPIPGDTDRDAPDGLMYLAICALGTSPALELGSCIYGMPLRNKYDVAQRFYTLETIAKGRFTLGLGTGSQQVEYEANGLDWNDRFRRMADHMQGLREIFAGQPTGPLYRHHPALDAPGTPVALDPAADRGAPWATQVGPPRVMLGSWHSPRQLRRAATEYDGWLASAGPGAQFGGWRKVLSEAITRYRDLGGRRAILSTVIVDFWGPHQPLAEDGVFNLLCSPAEAADRLAVIADLGFDDVLLALRSRRLASTRTGIARRYDFTAEDLEQVRALVPKDGRDYHDTPAAALASS